MDIELCKKAIKNYFATHTQKDIINYPRAKDR